MGARSRWEAQSPAAQPHQEGVTETWVSVEMGASKTVPPASIREETSVRHEVSSMIVRYEKDIRRTCGSVRSSLSAPARLVTVGSEAAETRFPPLRGERVFRKEGSKLRASIRFWESAE